MRTLNCQIERKYVCTVHTTDVVCVHVLLLSTLYNIHKVHFIPEEQNVLRFYQRFLAFFLEHFAHDIFFHLIVKEL
jgi:hypothetical protein